MYQVDDLVRQVNYLMVRTRTPFIEQYKDNEGNTKWMQRKYTLTDNILRDHFSGDRTVGIFYGGTGGTKFLVFDVDAEGDSSAQYIRVNGILSALVRAGIDPNNIHVMFSGLKGYHVQLFFEDMLPINSVVAFGRAILAQLKDYRSGVELRPESVNGRGVKLPLALHLKSGVFAHYVDRYSLEPVSNSVDYFMGISPIPKERMKAAIDRVLKDGGTKHASIAQLPMESLEKRLERADLEFADMHMPTNNSSHLRRYAESLLREGLKETGTRHHAQFILALYFKEQSKPVSQAIDEIQAWVKTQWERGMTKERNLGNLLREVSRNVSNIYSNSAYVGLYDSRGREPIMTYDDATLAASFEKRNTRRVMWALLMIGRMYHTGGVFAASMTSIAEMTGLCRQTVSKIMHDLIDSGLISVQEEYRYSQRKARVYYMEHLAKDSVPAEHITLEGATVGDVYRQSFEIVEALHRVA